MKKKTTKRAINNETGRERRKHHYAAVCNGSPETPVSLLSQHKRRSNTVGYVACTLIILLVIHLPHVALAQDGRGYLEVSGGYKTGDFGTATRSNLYYVAPVLGYVSSTYDLSVTAPYLFLDSDSDGQAGMMNMDGGIGISKMFGKTGIYSSFEGRNALVSDARNPQEINLGFFHVLNTDYAIKGSTFAGLNDGGPDFGFNFGIIRWF